MAKFKVGDKVIKANGRRWTTGEKYKKIELADSLVGYKLNRCLGYWKEEELKLFKEECEVEKTFREVIADIKGGQVWENPENRVRRIYINGKGNIAFEGDDNSFSINNSTCVDPNSIYKLQRKEYTFEEAFRAYEECKEIESVFSGYRYKKENGEDVAILSADWQEFDYFELYEIRGKWYIND